MTLPRVTFDVENGYAYIYLAEQYPGISETSVALEQPDPEDPEALDQIVLDFDRDGRLVGIEITRPAEAVLRKELIEAAADLWPSGRRQWPARRRESDEGVTEPPSRSARPA